MIRNNSNIILGLTGLIGSGCTSLSNLLAFEFSDKLKQYIDSYNNETIANIFNNLNRLKQVSRNIITCDDQLIEENNKLKDALIEREIVNILNKNRDILTNRFFYISFSAMIIFYVIKHLKDCTNNDLKSMVENVLQGNGFDLEESIKLTNEFSKKYYLFKKDKDRKEKFTKLYSLFYIIRDTITKNKGMAEMQNLGDNIRKYGNPFPNNMTKLRKRFAGRWLSSIVDKYIRLLIEYKYFVIECFRNPQELYYFREKYSYFYLIAICADKELRLRWSKLNKEEFELIEKREIEPQNENICELDVGKCMDIADIVIQNNTTLDVLFRKLLKYTALILVPGSIKPTKDETLMHVAYTLSVRSNCLSRQVGAIIVNADGYIIGAGWNDVGEGQLSCGIKLGKDYNNQYLKNSNININPDEQELYLCIKEKYYEKIAEHNKNKLSKSDFCPVLHAEENAILQLAKYHNGAIKEGRMYSTTFPCTNCLKKISQVGINTIVFSEPYINPLIELYVKQSIKDIQLIPFEGVKSYSYFKLFKPYYNKKESQIYLKENYA